jgi:KDO2-lipid IV(A) lauroyltransferase
MGRGTVKESLRYLKNGGLVAFALDQNARRKEGVFVPFFGREACTITSLALLARRTGAPVIPLYIYRDGDVHRIVVEKAILHDSVADTEADIIERTRVYMQWTEKVVRLHPQQWTWLHDRWKTKPKKELTR